VPVNRKNAAKPALGRRFAAFRRPAAARCDARYVVSGRRREAVAPAPGGQPDAPGAQQDEPGRDDLPTQG
jgi:hypothetical protein